MLQTLKDPDSKLPYSIDWTDWLESGDSIVSASWSASSGLTLESQYIDGAVTTAVVSGGQIGSREWIRCRVTSQRGYVDDQTIYLLIADK